MPLWQVHEEGIHNVTLSNTPHKDKSHDEVDGEKLIEIEAE